MPRFDYEGALLARQEDDGFVWEHIRPQSLEALRDLLEKSAQSGSYVVPGGPRSIPERLRDKETLFLDRSGLQAVLEHRREDQVISVETGMTVGQLDNILTESKQWWPVCAQASTTVAEVIELGEGGCLEHGFGGPRDLVLGLSAALATGDMISCGGKVVKNVTGYDLQKLLIGSRGWLGIVGEAHLRLFARPEASRTVMGVATTVGDAIAAAGELNRAGLSASCVELVDARLLKLLAEKSGSAPLRAVSEIASPDETVVSYAVLIQIHGQTVVVDDTMREIRRRLRPHLGSLPYIDGETADALWTVLSEQPASFELSKCSAAASASQMRALLEWLRTEEGSPFWQCRPGRGRITFHAQNADRISSLVGSLERWAGQTGETLVVAYSDHEYEWRVRRLPKEEERAASLKRAIKEKFDPSGILSPLVSM